MSSLIHALCWRGVAVCACLCSRQWFSCSSYLWYSFCGVGRAYNICVLNTKHALLLIRPAANTEGEVEIIVVCQVHVVSHSVLLRTIAIMSCFDPIDRFRKFAAENVTDETLSRSWWNSLACRLSRCCVLGLAWMSFHLRWLSSMLKSYGNNLCHLTTKHNSSFFRLCHFGWLWIRDALKSNQQKGGGNAATNWTIRMRICFYTTFR